MRRSYHSNFAFLDVLFNTLLCFAACFAIALIFMNQKKEDSGVEFSAYVIVIATWPGDYNDDVDLYMRDPTGEVVFFRNKSNSIMHLDRDDVGIRGEYEDTHGGRLPENREIITIRHPVEGEFTLNLHLYAKYSVGPLPVNVKILKISPRYEVFDGVIILESRNEEKTVCRFSVKESGKIHDINFLPVNIARNILRASPQ